MFTFITFLERGVLRLNQIGSLLSRSCACHVLVIPNSGGQSVVQDLQ